ncbi:MAG TPA: glycosyltransferase [Acetobacteraceae bacterium]|nr:glycosyltransferase [Acetobacteraceae bacterium]
MASYVESALVLNDYCYVQGGASKVAIDEAIALRAAGMNVTFLGAVGAPCEALLDAGVQVLSLHQPELLQVWRHPSAAMRAVWNNAAFAATRSLLAEWDAARTIVHLHGYTKALSTSPALAARLAGFATLCTLHDFFAACPNGAMYDYRREQPCERRALSVSCMVANCDKRHPLHKSYRVARGMLQRHFALFPQSVRDFVALSQRSAALLQPYLGPDAELYPLPNIIDVPHAPPVEVATNSHLCVLGRLDAEKGVTLAAEAARHAGMPIMFAGEGPLRAAAEACGAAVTGWLDSAGVWQALGQARCLVFPSRWYETFGLVVEEAASRGVPAIVSDISAAAERVEDGVTGWIFRSGDLLDLVRCMVLTQDPARVAAAGTAAYARFWADPPDRQRHVQALLGIYDKVLARGRAVGNTQGILAS